MITTWMSKAWCQSDWMWGVWGCRNLNGSQRRYDHWTTLNWYQVSAMCRIVGIPWERSYFIGQKTGQNHWGNAELVTDIWEDRMRVACKGAKTPFYGCFIDTTIRISSLCLRILKTITRNIAKIRNSNPWRFPYPRKASSMTLARFVFSTGHTLEFWFITNGVSSIMMDLRNCGNILVVKMFGRCYWCLIDGGQWCQLFWSACDNSV